MLKCWRTWECNKAYNFVKWCSRELLPPGCLSIFTKTWQMIYGTVWLFTLRTWNISLMEFSQFSVLRLTMSRNRDPADSDNLIVSRINYATRRISQVFANVGGFNNHTSQNFLIFILLEQWNSVFVIFQIKIANKKKEPKLFRSNLRLFDNAVLFWFDS